MVSSYKISSKIQHILTATGLLAISSLASRLLGVVRDHIFANKFGALTQTGIFDIDAYYAAFRIPDLLFNVLIYGTISSAFIPIFINYLKKENEEEGWKFTNATFNLIFLTIAALSIVVFIAAPWLMKLVVPGFDKEKLELTVNLTRIMLLSPIFFTISAFAQSIQNAYNYFIFYALAPILYNLGIIAATMFFADTYGVYGPTAGVVLGAALHAASQIPALWRLKYRYRFSLDRSRTDVREMIRLVLPRILGLSALQMTIIAYTVIASTLSSGTIAVFNYSINLNSLPMGIIGVSFAISSFAALSSHASKEEKSHFALKLTQTTRNILFLIIPASVGLIALRQPVTELILKSGSFGTEDAVLTANTLGIMGISLFAHSLIPLFGRAFYAWKNTKTPVIISLWSLAVSVITALLFTKYYQWGAYGLAVGFTVSAIINALWLGMAFKQKLQFHFTKDFWIAVAKFIAASIIMLIFVEQSKAWTKEYATWIQVATPTLLGIVVYIAAGYILKIREIKKYI